MTILHPIRMLARRVLGRLGRRLSPPAPAPDVASKEDLLAFWTTTGSDWATSLAEPDDLAVIIDLHTQTAGLAPDTREAMIVAALKAIWADGFSSQEDSAPWDIMPVPMPSWALAAFVEGAAQSSRRPGA
jgi:hypothetical protein